tara:strand:+ start:236 stop:913 length:678 start_codon:yes stop_codon:yes gene_type:complete
MKIPQITPTWNYGLYIGNGTIAEKKENTMNRETYLNLIIDKAEPIFAENDYDLKALRAKIMVACGYPPNTRIGAKFNTLGVHINPKASSTSKHEIFINPVVDDTYNVIDILLHELVHAVQTDLYPESKSHGKEFISICKKVGMNGSKKYAQACAGIELSKLIKEWIKEIGKYPHGSINLKADRKKQSTRLIKLECSCCGFIARCSNGAINNYGLPFHCGVEMDIA